MIISQVKRRGREGWVTGREVDGQKERDIDRQKEGHRFRQTVIQRD